MVWYEELAVRMAKHIAVVLLNAPCAEFADVIVLIPGVAVLLVEAKYYGEKTGLNPAKVEEALVKMGHPPKATLDKTSSTLTQLSCVSRI